MTPGEIVKQLREAHKMTRSELAAKMDVSTSSINKWEANIRTICQDELIKLSNLFNVSVDYILGLKYDSIDIAFYNQLGNLTPEQKEDVIRYAQFIRSKNEI